MMGIIKIAREMTMIVPLIGRRKKMVKSLPELMMLVMKYLSARGPRISKTGVTVFHFFCRVRGHSLFL